jgi:hypothetical protein
MPFAVNFQVFAATLRTTSFKSRQTTGELCPRELHVKAKNLTAKGMRLQKKVQVPGTRSEIKNQLLLLLLLAFWLPKW